MNCPLEQAINTEYTKVERKEFTVYFRENNVLYRRTTVRNYSLNDFIDSTYTIAIGKSNAEEDLKVSSNFTINGKEVSVSSKKVEKHELQEIRNVGYIWSLDRLGGWKGKDKGNFEEWIFEFHEICRGNWGWEIF